MPCAAPVASFDKGAAHRINATQMLSAGSSVPGVAG